MNKEELELYDMILNSKKSFDVNYKELAISLRAELKKTKDRIDKAMNEISSFCKECPSHECCPEDECVLYRIEQIIWGNEK